MLLTPSSWADGALPPWMPHSHPVQCCLREGITGVRRNSSASAADLITPFISSKAKTKAIKQKWENLMENVCSV